MKEEFSKRFQKAINMSGLKPIEVANKTGLDKSLISCYLSGKYKPTSINLEKLANTLNVSEIWLEGYDVDINGNRKEMLFNYFPQNLKYLLDSGKLNTNKIIEITGVKSPSIVTMWKNGERQITTKYIVALANYLNLSVDDLVNRNLSDGMKIQKFVGNDELDILYYNNKHLLTESDKTIIKTIIEQRIKEKEN